MKADEKKCPRCAEVIKKDALVCKHCGHEFSADDIATEKAKDAKNAKHGALGCFGLIGFILLIGMCAQRVQPPAGTNEAVANESADAGAPSHDKYIEQLKREVASLEKHERLDTSDWTSKDAIMIQVALIGVWGKLYAEGKDYTLTPADKALRERFRKLVSAEQVRRFPALRAAQARIFDKGMWEADVDVAATGAGNSNLRLTGGMFAANRNIKEGVEALSDTLGLLRFRRATFEWYRGSENTYYDLKPLADSVVATMGSGNWVTID